ncbi:hypothetical protein IT575_15710 [bacterium]|nr:hypothetical protein [bacterium]
MYTQQSMLDIHARAQRNLHALIGFCATLPAEALTTRLPGFGFPTIMIQLEHIIGSEWYWQLVLTSGYNEEVTHPELPNLGAVEAFRQRIAAGTQEYLLGAGEDELNTLREMVSDPGETRMLRPADVILRMVTHIYNHQGQVLAMARTLGHANNDEWDLDYPLD